jgi:hypothetical protein
MDGWMDGSKSCFKDCLQQSKTELVQKAFSLKKGLGGVDWLLRIVQSRQQLFNGR